jgi:hypothetical protein
MFLRHRRDVVGRYEDAQPSMSTVSGHDQSMTLQRSALHRLTAPNPVPSLRRQVLTIFRRRFGQATCRRPRIRTFVMYNTVMQKFRSGRSRTSIV